MDAKLNYMRYSACVTGPLSIIGSSLTLLTLHRGRGKGFRTYHRLLVGISVADILLSLGMALGPAPIPADSGMPGAHGNTATCTFQGVLLQLGVASFAYSLMLMIYYVLVIRWSMRETIIATRIEPVLHAIPISFFASTTFAAIGVKAFNPSWTVCWFGVYPLGCDQNPAVECERGEDYKRLFSFWLLTIPLLILNLLTILALLVIAGTVWIRNRSSQRFVFRASHSDSDGTSTTRRSLGIPSSLRSLASFRRKSQASTATSTPRSTRANPQNARTNQVIVQSLLYGVSFVNMLIWSTVGTILEQVLQEDYDPLGKHFWIAALWLFFFPLQGLCNFLIFIRPRYRGKRKLFPERRCWFVLRQAVWNPNSTRSEMSTATSRNRRKMESSNAAHSRIPQQHHGQRESKTTRPINNASHKKMQDLTQKTDVTESTKSMLPDRTEEADVTALQDFGEKGTKSMLQEGLTQQADGNESKSLREGNESNNVED